MQTIRFTIHGPSVAKGSIVSFVPRMRDGSYAKRPDGSPLVVSHDESGQRGKRHASAIAEVALRARREAGADVARGVGVVVSLAFYEARAMSHFGTGRNEGRLKLSAPLRPARRPDVDKLTRQILDALKGVLYVDDGQVVTLLATKHYAEGNDPPRTEVEVTILPERMGMVEPSQLSLAA